MNQLIKHAWYRAKFHIAPYVPLSFPVHVDIELAGKCQLACIMCPFGDNADGTGSFDSSMQGMMPIAMAKEALRQAREGGALSVKLNFRGEPGLSKNLEAMTAYAKSLGFVDIMINTNLTAFTPTRLKALTEAGLDKLIVSVDGATAETYEAIRIKGRFNRLVELLQYLTGLKYRPNVRIQMVVQDTNRHEVEKMKEVFGSLCDDLIFNKIREDNTGERKQCPQPWQRLVIMWDGQIGACCSNWRNEAVIGKFPEQSLKDIWEGEKRKELLYFAQDPNRGGPCKGCLVGGSYK